MSLKRQNLIVFGYVRRLISKTCKHLIIPIDVQEIILHFFRNYFEWCIDPCGEGFEFYENDANKVRYIKHRNCAFLVSKNILSLALGVKRVEWEVELHTFDPNNTSDDGHTSESDMSIDFGFVKYPASETILNLDGYAFTQDPKCVPLTQFCVFATSSSGNFALFDGEANRATPVVSDTEILGEKFHGIKNGDRMEIQLDFVKKECDFYYNGKFMATVYKNIPEEVVPAINCYLEMTVKCTKWKIY